ncbi:hypothetical protein NKJ26_05035 [Mesorhizobium sp. M0152]|uniref:hypothetical protein n=1 Tax=Mesorhizobium sp. M0152 TaxID=2956898 RepID=UPI003336D45C
MLLDYCADRLLKLVCLTPDIVYPTSPSSVSGFRISEMHLGPLLACILGDLVGRIGAVAQGFRSLFQDIAIGSVLADEFAHLIGCHVMPVRKMAQFVVVRRDMRTVSNVASGVVGHRSYL